MSNIYWVGVRESDLLAVDGLYSGSITFFGSGKNGNHCLFRGETARKDHNQQDPLFDSFYTQTMQLILQEDSTARFMFYNQDMIYHTDPFLREHILCQNTQNLLQILNNKMLCKLWLKELVPLLPSIQLFGSEISQTMLKKYFPNDQAFVIQPDFSSGGHNTYLLTDKNEINVMEKLSPVALYTVSSYKGNAIPINIHGMAYQDGFQLYPASIQLIRQKQDQLLYEGGDFLAFTMLSDEIRDYLYSIAEQVSEKLVSVGYLGVYGIDLIVTENDVYFMEINPRFQASTPVLNYALQQQGRMSIHQHCIEAFNGGHISGGSRDILGMEVNYSIFSYTASETDMKFSKHIWRKYFSSHPAFSVLADGYRPEIPVTEGAYLFRAIYAHNLVSLSPEGIRLAELLTGFPCDRFESPMCLKTMLICYGITISEQVISRMGYTLRQGNFAAIDIGIEIQGTQLTVNCPYKTWPSEYSPFDIRIHDGGFMLFFFDIPVSPVQFYYESPLNQVKTASGVPYSSVAFLATDRLRINYRPVCYYKLVNQGCMFCNLPEQNTPYCEEDIQEIIDGYLRSEDFRHILIGGGSASPDSQFQEIIRLTDFLHKRTAKPLYLMSLPPKNPRLIRELYEAGISEMAFNIEIFDRSLATKYMPGKGLIPLERYMNSLVEATKWLGRSGNVRSMLIVGFDPKETLFEGIRTLCEIGVQPMLSVFRPMAGTPLEMMLSPGLNDLLEIFEHATSICAKYGLKLGPSCPNCQNNTLSLPETYDSHSLDTIYR